MKHKQEMSIDRENMVADRANISIVKSQSTDLMGILQHKSNYLRLSTQFCSLCT